VDGVVVVADAPDRLLVASPLGVRDVRRIGADGADAGSATLISGTATVLAVRRIDGKRLVAAHVDDVVRVIEGDGNARDVALPAGRAEVRSLVIDAAGRIVVVREAVVDTLEPGGTSFARNVLVGSMRAWSAVAAADGDGIFVVGEEGEHGIVVRVTKNGQQTLATTETRIWRAWASKSAVWGIDTKDRLYRIDLATREVRVEHPDVGAPRAISGIETAKGDLVVVVGEVAALFDNKRFAYPGGATTGGSSVAVDADSCAAYVAGQYEPKMIPLVHPWLVERAKMFETSLGFGPERGPLRPPEPPEKRGITAPSLRLGYGYGWDGGHDSSEFDAAAGLRIGMRLADEPHFFFWPELGYTATLRGRFAMLGAGLHWGNVIASTGPAVTGLLGADENGSQAAGIRSAWHAAFIAGLLNVELGHQLMFVPGGPRHDGRALASVDLLAGGGLLVYLGIPLGILSGVLLTEALR
jgi:hypothetical protein